MGPTQSAPYIIPMFTHRLRYLFILGLAVYSYLNTEFSEAFRYYGIRESSLVLLLFFGYICLVVWEGNRLVMVWMSGAGRAADKLPGKLHPLLGQFLLSLPIAAFAGGSAYLLARWLRPDHSVAEWMIAGKLIMLFAFRINLFLLCLHAMVFLQERVRLKEKETESLRQMSTQARLQAIRNQVNPHFLFNNLNVLSSLVLQQSSEANRFIEKFSAVYRTLLTHQDRDLITLREELAFIDPYVYLLQKRFGEGLQVTLDIDPDALDCQLVPVVLQMLMENAIKHNAVSVRKPLLITVRTLGKTAIEVRNNLQPRLDKEPSTQIGLENIRQRVQLTMQRDILIERTDQHFAVQIPLVYS